MKALLENIWVSRTPRERQALGIGLSLLVVALYIACVIAFDRARAGSRAAVETLRMQAYRLDQHAQELARLRAAPQPRPAAGDVRTLVQTQARAAGLDRALVSLDAIDASQVRAVFDSVPYAAWLTWTATLQSQFVQLASCRIEALSGPGLVRITATFSRAAS